MGHLWKHVRHAAILESQGIFSLIINKYVPVLVEKKGQLISPAMPNPSGILFGPGKGATPTPYPKYPLFSGYFWEKNWLFHGKKTSFFGGGST